MDTLFERSLTKISAASRLPAGHEIQRLARQKASRPTFLGAGLGQSQLPCGNTTSRHAQKGNRWRGTDWLLTGNVSSAISGTGAAMW